MGMKFPMCFLGEGKQWEGITAICLVYINYPFHSIMHAVIRLSPSSPIILHPMRCKIFCFFGETLRKHIGTVFVKTLTITLTPNWTRKIVLWPVTLLSSCTTKLTQVMSSSTNQHLPSSLHAARWKFYIWPSSWSLVACIIPVNYHRLTHPWPSPPLHVAGVVIVASLTVCTDAFLRCIDSWPHVRFAHLKNTRMWGDIFVCLRRSVQSLCQIYNNSTPYYHQLWTYNNI